MIPALLNPQFTRKKDETEVEIYEHDGKNFYIMSNLDSETATWSDGTFKIDIVGQLTADEIKQIIDSIGA